MVALSLFLPAAAEDRLAEFGPYELPADTLMVMPGPRVKIEGSERPLTAVGLSTRDETGRAIEGSYICHTNVGPSYRNFHHGRKVLLDGYTKEIRVPKGFAIALEGELAAEAAYNNPEHAPLKGVKSELRFEYAPQGAEGLVKLYPQMMSVFEQPPSVAPGNWGYYVGPKSKDTRRRSYEVTRDYVIHHVSAHIHEHGRRLALVDKTRGRLIAEIRPRYKGGRISDVDQVELPQGVALRKGDRLELTVEYENELASPIDAMGAMIVFGRCTDGNADCAAIAQGLADNAAFDPKVYASIVGGNHRCN